MQIKAKKGLIAVLLSATTLTSCASLQNKKIKVSEIRDALSYEEGLTNLDEQLKIIKIEKYETNEEVNAIDNPYYFRIEELEYELRQNKLICNITKCNNMLKAIIYELLKTEISEYLEVSYESVSSFKITGTRYYTNNNIDPLKKDFYSIEFNYGGINYTILADNQRAYDLCYRYRACEKCELDYDEIQECYNYIKKAMLYKAKISNKPQIIEGRSLVERSPITYNFNGTLDLKMDKAKEKIFKTLVKKKNVYTNF